MNKILKGRLKGKDLTDNIPDWNRITFKDKVPRPWEREKEMRKARERRIIEVEIPAELIKNKTLGRFPLKRAWRWAQKNYPDRKFFFRGRKLFMVED